MSKRAKRPTYRRPDVARQAPAAPPSGQSQGQQGGRRDSDRSLADWWPLAVAAGATALLVLIVLLANLDSPPPPSMP